MQKTAISLAPTNKTSRERTHHSLLTSRLCRILAVSLVIFTSTFAASATIFNVQTYGAYGDNSHDDRASIQNAINAAAAAGGGTVYFPAGLYNVHDTINVPSNVRLLGNGSTVYNTQIRLMQSQRPLFEVNQSGATNIVFKDLMLISVVSWVWPRNNATETALIRGEGTIGISFRAPYGGISNVVVENVRASQFTNGIRASSWTGFDDNPITGVKLRNFVSDGNEYALHTRTLGANDWDVQNMNVYPMYDGQNGIFLEKSGTMRFLQLSCAGVSTAKICAKLWDNGETYFRQTHTEGPQISFCIGSNCDGTPGGGNTPNPAKITIENSAHGAQVHRESNISIINNRFWLDFPGPGVPVAYEFFGAGASSSFRACGNVWVSWNPATHMSNTTVQIPNGAIIGLGTPIGGCVSNDLKTVPTFSTGYDPDFERLPDEIDVTSYPYSATPSDGLDDTASFQAAILAARATRTKRIYVPPGTFDISSTLFLEKGETIVGRNGGPIMSEIVLHGENKSLFKILNGLNVVNGINVRNLVLSADSKKDTVGVHFENYSTSVVGAASDFQITNVDFNSFGEGIAVKPIGSTFANPQPMFDTVAIRDGIFTNNATAIHTMSGNASHWNLEGITVNNGSTTDGVTINYGGHISIRGLTCSGSGNSCAKIQRQGGVSIDGMTSNGDTNALLIPWENGWTQFPVTVRNGNLLKGVYVQGRAYLNSVNNLYPAKIAKRSISKVVRFGALYEGDPLNVAYGGQSNVYSCGDLFYDITNGSSIPLWQYEGTLLTGVTYCQ